MRCLSEREKTALRPFLPACDLHAARIHEDHVPWYLPRCFVAITRGNHIFLRAGAYHPDTLAGLALLGHELAHVGQYRRGMTAVGYLLSAIRGYRNSRYEREACALQARIIACAPRESRAGTEYV